MASKRLGGGLGPGSGRRLRRVGCARTGLESDRMFMHWSTRHDVPAHRVPGICSGPHVPAHRACPDRPPPSRRARLLVGCIKRGSSCINMQTRSEPQSRCPDAGPRRPSTPTPGPTPPPGRSDTNPRPSPEHPSRQRRGPGTVSVSGRRTSASIDDQRPARHPLQVVETPTPRLSSEHPSRQRRGPRTVSASRRRTSASIDGQRPARYPLQAVETPNPRPSPGQPSLQRRGLRTVSGGENTHLRGAVASSPRYPRRSWSGSRGTRPGR